MTEARRGAPPRAPTIRRRDAGPGQGRSRRGVQGSGEGGGGGVAAGGARVQAGGGRGVAAVVLVAWAGVRGGGPQRVVPRARGGRERDGGPAVEVRVVAGEEYRPRGNEVWGSLKKNRKPKESMAVMFGLCIGGHLSAAKSFFESGSGVGVSIDSTGLVWDKRPDSEHMQDARAGNFGEFGLLPRICEAGHLEMLQWVTGAFGIKESWQMFAPLRAALRGGSLEITKWILAKFVGLEQKLHQREFSRIALDLAMACASGKDPHLTRWLMEQFSFLSENDSSVSAVCDILLNQVLCNKGSTLELCQWMTNHLSLYSSRLYFHVTLINTEIRHWATTNFPKRLIYGNLRTFCRVGTEVQFAEWLVSEGKATPTTQDFVASCCNQYGNLELTKWASSKVVLSPDDLKQGLLSALSHSNIRIANWLEQTYSVMKMINSQGSGAVSKAFVEILKSKNSGEDTVDGIEWFVGRLTAAVELDKYTALEQLDQAATKMRPKLTLYIIKSFRILLSICASSDTTTKGGLLAKLLKCVAQWSLSAVKELTSLLPFSVEDVAQALSSDSVVFLCSDAVRWLVETYHLTSSHIKANHNVVLYQLILSNKKGCAEWLIDSFGICLDDVVDMFMKWLKVDPIIKLHVSTWRMIISKFPEMDCDTAWKIMRRLANMASIAEYTLKWYHVEENSDTEQTLLHNLSKCYLAKTSNEFQLWKADKTDRHLG
ncbi:hypothetical protein Pelo_2713 [Pelomyxa schiedti]|nr:hypothetical protein Pelo_2713 [Pelomyxa schiedti]